MAKTAKADEAFAAPKTPGEPVGGAHSESTGFAQAMIDALSAHLCVLDGAGKILTANRAWREWAAANLPAGRAIAEGASYLAGCDAAAGPGADVAGAFAAGIRAVLRGERPEFSLEYPCHSPAEPRWFIGRVARFAGAGPVRVVVTHENITARRQAEAALQASEEKLRAIVENTADVECWFNPDGTLRWVNPAVENVTGYTVAESFAMAGFPLPLFAAEDAARGTAGFRAAVAESRGHDFEASLVRKDGTGRWVSVSWQPICAHDGTSLGHRASVRDITERKRAEEELRASREELRALAARLQAVREEERTEVAREIHDVLAQELTRLKIDLVWLQRRLLKASGAGAGTGLGNRVAEMIQMADTTIHAVQRIATGLRPAVLDSLGLCAAIEWQVRDFQTHAGIECQVRVPEVEPALSREAATAAFRIFQEGLTNVLRHARATRVEIALWQDGGQLLLAIKDNGVGVQPGALTNPMSFGLVGMRERALILGGRLEIQSQSGAGTTIEVRLPLAGKAGAAAT